MKICANCGTHYNDSESCCPECRSAEYSSEQERACPKCGSPYKEGSEFCGKCGCRLKEVPCPKCGTACGAGVNICPNCGYDMTPKPSMAGTGGSGNGGDPSALYIDSDEKLIAKLGSGYVQNIITSGNISSVAAYLTDKRIYLSGKCFDISGGGLKKMALSRIIDIGDVTGTGFEYTSNLTWIILAVLALIVGIILMASDVTAGFWICLLAAVVFGVIYFLRRKTIFCIEYAGGGIGFDVKWLNKEESVKFQKLIHKTKQEAKSK